MPKTNPLNEARRASEPKQAAPAARPARIAADSTRLVGAHFPEEVYRQVRVLAATEGRSLRATLVDALNDLFVKRKLPPIA